MQRIQQYLSYCTNKSTHISFEYPLILQHVSINADHIREPFCKTARGKAKVYTALCSTQYIIVKEIKWNVQIIYVPYIKTVSSVSP
jgi:hypothetical protein